MRNFLVLAFLLFPICFCVVFSSIALFITPNMNDNSILAQECPLLLNTVRFSTMQGTLFLIFMCFVQTSPSNYFQLKRWTTCGWVRFLLIAVCSASSAGAITLNVNTQPCVIYQDILAQALYLMTILNSWYICLLLMVFAVNQKPNTEEEPEPLLS